MQPTSPVVVNQDGTPNPELLLRMGWSIASYTGDYCVAWRGRDEVVFEWQAGQWHRVGGRGGVDDI